MYRITGYEATPDNPLASGAFLKDFQFEKAIVDWLKEITGPELRGHILIESIEII